MILSLHIHNIALIEDLTIPFARGLHALTGETGAGKSIIVDAVNLVLGGRAERDLIRNGTDKAWVEAIFDAADCPNAMEVLQENSIDCEDGLITLYRELNRSGRGLCRICGMVMPVAVLKSLASCLMDVHGQHEHEFLMNPKYHLSFLDATGGAEHQQLLAEVREACEAFLETHRQYARLVRENDQKTYRMESLKKSLEELDKAKLRLG